ncbi:MAG: metal-dependent transcriptional regulator [Clostridia bacterium]
MKRQESTEDYLETILLLGERLGMVRSIDIATEMGFTKPSVSVSMKNLRQKACITMDAGGAIKLTEQGEAIARGVYERHQVLTQALVALGVSQEVAREDACRVEHDISPETFECIKAHMKQHG